MNGIPSHVSEWQPKRNFVDKDGKMNDKLYEYIKNEKSRCLGQQQEEEELHVKVLRSARGAEASYQK